MKRFASFISVGMFVFSLAAEAKTVLHVPFFVEYSSGPANSPNYDYVPVQEVNKILTKNGQTAQTESVDLTVDTQFNFMDVRDALDAALNAAGIKDGQAMGELFPQQFSTENVFTCYRGDANGVIDIVLANVDSMYSDQYTLIAWRVGKKVVLGDNLEAGKETNKYLNSSSALWKNYDKNSDNVLILAAVGDDGTDVNESLIPRCK